MPPNLGGSNSQDQTRCVGPLGLLKDDMAYSNQSCRDIWGGGSTRWLSLGDWELDQVNRDISTIFTDCTFTEIYRGWYTLQGGNKSD